MNNGNRRRTQRQLSRTGRMRGARPTEAIEESVSGLNSRVLHRGTKHLEDLRNQDNDRSKRAMVRFREGGEEGNHSTCGMLGGSKRGQIERLSVERNSRQESGMTRCGGTSPKDMPWKCCRKETICIHAIWGKKTGWSSLIHNRVLHEPLARSLRDSYV